jgi:tripeptide aminopeptidase
MRAYERFIKYAAVHTRSDEHSESAPSSAIQFDLAKVLVSELEAIGCENVRCDEKCYVYAEIPASSGCENAVKLGFIAHMDTSPDFCGEGVKPRLIENYDGGKVALGCGRELSPEVFPHLPSLAGRTLITTDGSTLLGADDKAGIAEIVTVAERIITENIPHGKILIGFTPDEEIGAGADHFDVDGFGADFAYTVDGGAEGSLEYENFNACAAHFTVNGFNVHPGSAKNVMINASLVAMEINSLLPGADVPSKTDGYEGFFHLTDMKGCCERAELDYIVRDHDAKSFECRKKLLYHIEKTLNEKYGENTVELHIKEQYANMAEQIRPCMHLVDNAVKAAGNCGIKALIEPIRGGTDGARLSYMGLPCPNLGTGGYAFHGPYEHITIEGMDKQADILLEIVKIYSGEYL